MSTATYVDTVLPGGLKIRHRHTPADLGVLHQVFVEQQYSPARMVTSAWPRIAQSATCVGCDGVPLVVDLGANIGAAAIFFKLIFPDTRVVAVEPERENYELLLHNTASLDNVFAVEAAIAAERGTVDLIDPGKGAWAFQTGPTRGNGTVVSQVDAITIDDVIEASGGAVPFLLKVDIEGAEGDFFGARWETLSRFPLVVVELHDRLVPEAETSRSFLRWHLKQGRDIYTLGEHVFSIDPSMRQSPGYPG